MQHPPDEREVAVAAQLDGGELARIEAGMIAAQRRRSAPQWAAPVLDGYPAGGPPGTHVEIRGSKFHRSVAVFLGDQPMPIVAFGDRFIVAVVPRYVRGDDFIYVVDGTGRARSFVPFDVIRSPRYRDPRYPGPVYRHRA